MCVIHYVYDTIQNLMFAIKQRRNELLKYSLHVIGVWQFLGFLLVKDYKCQNLAWTCESRKSITPISLFSVSSAYNICTLTVYDNLFMTTQKTQDVCLIDYSCLAKGVIRSSETDYWHRKGVKCFTNLNLYPSVYQYNNLE